MNRPTQPTMNWLIEQSGCCWGCCWRPFLGWAHLLCMPCFILADQQIFVQNQTQSYQSLRVRQHGRILLLAEDVQYVGYVGFLRDRRLQSKCDVVQYIRYVSIMLSVRLRCCCSSLTKTDYVEREEPYTLNENKARSFVLVEISFKF